MPTHAYRSRLLATVTMIAVALPLFACATARSDASHGAGTPAAGHTLTVAEVYTRMRDAISRPDQIYHPTIEAAALQGAFTLAKRQELWIDASAGRARVEVQSAFGGGANIHTSTWIIDGDRWYQTLEEASPRKRQALTCHQSDDAALSLLLGCHGFTEQSISAVRDGLTYDGHDAIAVISTGIAPGADVRQAFADTLYIDSTTYLPIAIESNGRLADATAQHAVTTVQDTGELTRYTNDFVPAASIAPSSFDPATIGYRERDAAAALAIPRPDFSYLWLGDAVEPSGGLPGLVLDGAFVADRDVRPFLRYRAVLKYRVAGDDFAPSAIEMQEWRLDDWQSSAEGNNWWDAACAQRIDSGGVAATAIIYTTDSAEQRDGCRPSDRPRIAAEIKIGTTVAIVTPADGSPYASVDGMRRTIEAIGTR